MWKCNIVYVIDWCTAYKKNDPLSAMHLPTWILHGGEMKIYLFMMQNMYIIMTYLCDRSYITLWNRFIFIAFMNINNMRLAVILLGHKKWWMRWVKTCFAQHVKVCAYSCMHTGRLASQRSPYMLCAWHDNIDRLFNRAVRLGNLQYVLQRTCSSGF